MEMKDCLQVRCLMNTISATRHHLPPPFCPPIPSSMPHYLIHLQHPTTQWPTPPPITPSPIWRRHWQSVIATRPRHYVPPNPINHHSHHPPQQHYPWKWTPLENWSTTMNRYHVRILIICSFLPLLVCMISFIFFFVLKK